MTTWTAKVGLRRPTGFGHPLAYVHTVLAQIRSESQGQGLMQIIEPTYNAYRDVPYDQGGVIGGPVVVTNDTGKPIEVRTAEQHLTREQFMAAVDRHLPLTPFCVTCTSAVCVCGVGAVSGRYAERLRDIAADVTEAGGRIRRTAHNYDEVRDYTPYGLLTSLELVISELTDAVADLENLAAEADQ